MPTAAVVLRKSSKVGIDLYVTKSLSAALVNIADSNVLVSVLDNLSMEERVFMILLS